MPRGADIKEALRGYVLGSRQHWRTKIPFLIRLRHLRDGLPQPDDLPAHLSTALGQPPEDWVGELLREGDALLLIDGVDEVPEGEPREAVLNSIADYVALYGRCPVIVASRPRAFDNARLRALRFIEAEVDELTPEQRACFIDSWHRALAANVGRAEDDPDVTRYAEQLKGALDRQPHIARLATNPLLCAGICALHERNPETLPKDEYDLCAKLTEMLVERRDRSPGRQKPIRLEEFGAAYRLPYADKRAILARIAEAMVSQKLSVLPRDEALDHVAKALPELRPVDGLTPELVLRALEARSGVLRGAGGERAVAPTVNELVEDATPCEAVEFVHNTLKAWLASLHCLHLNKPRELAERALVSDHGEVIRFAVAAPEGRVYADVLIDSLLQRADNAADAETRRMLLILAMRCDAVAPSLPAALRERLATLPGLLFPPRSFDEAVQLAVLGDAALPHLAPRPDLSDVEAAACARCLRLIGTEGARKAIGAYRATETCQVVEELAEIVNPINLPLVLGAAQDREQWKIAPGSVKVKIADLNPLKEHQHLRRLFLDGTQVRDLTPLQGLTGLQRLSLRGTQVSDLTPLRDLIGLRTLFLAATQVSDLTPLRGLTGLQRLILDGTQVSDLTPLQGLTGLQWLVLAGTQVSDLTPLQGLTGLHTLFLAGTQLSDLTPLRNLIGLHTLFLGGTQVRDLTPLQGLTRVQQLILSGTQVSDLTPLQGLTGLHTLSLAQTPVSPDEVARLKEALVRNGNCSLTVAGTSVEATGGGDDDAA